MAALTKAAEVIADYLKLADIAHVFGYPGTPNIELIEALRQSEIEVLLGTREGTVGFMAEAYGMLTGRPGVCFSTLGPGSTALVNPVAAAYLDRVPMIAFSGQISSHLEPMIAHQVVDHNRLFAPISKWVARLEPSLVSAIMRKAFRVAMAERPGPVHITTSGDALASPTDDVVVDLPPFKAIDSSVVNVDAKKLEAEGIFRGARKPLLLAGIAATRSGATEELIRVSEHLGCPVVVAPMAKGVFPEDHRNFAGVLDMACNQLVWDLLEESDLIIAVGFDPVELIKPWAVGTRVVHVDAVPNLDQIYSSDVELVGDIPATLRGLVASVPAGERWDRSDIERHQRALSDRFHDGRVRGKLNPSEVVEALNASFLPGTIVTTDVGSHKLLVAQGWRAHEPRTFLTTNGLSAMGFALPAAMAAKLVHPERDVVCTVGDGGFAMVQGELRVAASRKLGLVVVVFCDGSLNRIEMKQKAMGYPSVGTRIETYDIAALAEAMGCHGARVATPTQLQAVLDGHRDDNVPLVIQAMIDPTQYDVHF